MMVSSRPESKCLMINAKESQTFLTFCVFLVNVSIFMIVSNDILSFMIEAGLDFSFLV